MNLTRQSTRLLTAITLSCGLFFVFFGVASAHTMVANHAKVNRAIPAIDSTIATAPTTVTVFTVENMKTDLKDSNLLVYGPSGDLISTGNAKFDVNNPQTMSVTIKPEKDGVYIVRWNNVSSDDNDPDQGAFTFTVKSGTTAAATMTPAKTTPAPTTSGTPVWVPILVGIVALLLGLGAGFVFGSNRRSTPMVVPSASSVVPEEETTRRSYLLLLKNLTYKKTIRTLLIYSQVHIVFYIFISSEFKLTNKYFHSTLLFAIYRL